MSVYEKRLIPPLNFSMVDSGVYRSGFPNKKNFKFLQRFGLRSVLYLCHQDYLPDNLTFAQKNDIQIFYCPIDGNKEPFLGIDPDAMIDALRHLLDVRNHPILVHCTKGTHRTGCVIGCLRKMQHWSLTSIIDEYCRFAGPRMRLLDQQFIEFFSPNFDFDHEHAPKWPLLAINYSTSRVKKTSTQENSQDPDATMEKASIESQVLDEKNENKNIIGE